MSAANVGDRAIAVIEGNWYELVDGVLMGGAVKVDGSLDGLDEPYEVMGCDYEAVLCALLDAWCKKYSIAPASADELLPDLWAEEGDNGDDRSDKAAWLEGFIKLWDEKVCQVARVARAAGKALEAAYPFGYRSSDREP